MKNPLPFRRHLLGACLALTALTASATPEQYWVSPTGSDTNNGLTPATAWQTVTHARDYLTTNGRNSPAQADDIIINLIAGEYVLTAPVVFDRFDSGGGPAGAEFDVVYRSADGPGAARLVGAADLNVGTDGNPWTPLGGGSPLWVIQLNAGLKLGTLYENDKRGWVARSPNYQPKARYPLYRGAYKVSTGGNKSGTTHNLQYAPGDFDPAAWGPLTSAAQVVWWRNGGTANWGTDKPSPIQSINTTLRNFVLTVDAATPPPTPGTGERYYVQGIRELLDAPGEFFYDPTDGLLYYYPQDGDPNLQDIRVPTATRLLTVSGGTPALPIHHLRFEGLAFAYTNCAFSNLAQTITLNDFDGALYVRYGHNIEVRDCLFEQLGSGAVYLRDNSHHNTITGCSIRHMGLGGIWLYNGVQRSDPTYPNARSEFNVITNCQFSDIGEVLTPAVGCAGVLLVSASNNEISHSEFSNCARYAVSLRGNWRDEGGLIDNGLHYTTGNLVHHVRATDGLQDSGDAGLIHSAGVNVAGGPNINTWEQLLVSGAYADASMDDPQKPNGIFLDYPGCTYGQSFRHIKIAATQSGSFRTNHNPTQTTHNVSWTGSFNETLIDYANIGLTSAFPAAYHDPITVVADDHTIDYGESDPAWADSSIAGLHRGDGRYHAYAVAAPYAEWRPTLPATGNYDVFIHRMNPDAGASATAPYAILHTAGTQSFTVDQQTGAAGWVYAGNFRFAAGRVATNSAVRLLTNSSDTKPVRADAVTFALTALDAEALDGERGWWKFDNSAADASGNVATASLLNGAAYTASAPVGSHALALDGVNDYAEVADSPSLDIDTGDFAFALWFYRDANAITNLRLLSKGAGLDSKPGYAVFGSDGLISVAVGNGTARKIFSATYPGTAQWVHLAVNIDRAGAITLYLDGVIAGSMSIADWAGQDLSSADPLNIGRNVNSGSLHWPGRVDDLRIFRRQLTPAEIAFLATP
ncbi:MAG: right-handed parallel beta-helix repeat-containing protein [Lacunisphaera sp.]|nr:right-handed parallel beta-helix repeat-containing protein [Lacunisphaera sp.]